MVVQQEWRGEIGGSSSSSSSTGNSSPHGSFADMITFMREEREHMEQKMKERTKLRASKERHQGGGAGAD